MHILIALTYYRPHYSGLTIYAEREARALAKRGHKVTILTSRYDEILPAYEKKDGVEIIRLDVWLRISKGVIMPSMPIKAWEIVHSADIVHLHAPQLDAALIALVSRILGKPVVLTYHCDLRTPKGFIHSVASGFLNCANHITALAAQAIVHNTWDYAEHSPFLRRYIEKIHPIYPPIEIGEVKQDVMDAFRERFQIQPDQRIIGMAARLATEKGVEYLAQALPLVRESIPQARTLFVGPFQNVVGEEKYARHLTPLIESLGDGWTFLDVLTPDEMACFFQVCEVLVLPSINSTESFGMVQVEAMAYGTPVVASDLPGVRVPVNETHMGIIVPPENPVEIAQAIIKILEQPERFRGTPDALLPLTTADAVTRAYEELFLALVEQSKD